MISKEKDLDKLLTLILDESLTLTKSDAGSIYFREEIDHEDLLVFKCSINRSSDIDYVGKTIKVNDESVSGHVTRTGETIIINQSSDNDEVQINTSFDQLNHYQTVNMIVVPMKNEMGRVVGVFQILNKQSSIEKDALTKIVDYTDEDVELILSLASQCAILIDRIKIHQKLERNVQLTRSTLTTFFNSMKQAMNVIGDDILKEQKEFKELATVDRLTGLLLREEGLAFVQKQLEFAALNGTNMVIAFIDVNDLKYVNDTYGHHEGDYLLKSVVNLITSVHREGDFMFRYGGDEFILSISNANLHASSRLKVRIDKAFAEFNDKIDKPYTISASFGFAEFNYKNKRKLDELIEIADQNMYQNKQAYKTEQSKKEDINY